jgi:hypothetical protein
MLRSPVDREGLEGLETPEEYAGYGLCDPEGNRIGRVLKVFANDDREPEYIRVGLGLLGTKSALIPVQGVKVDGNRRHLVLE